ncbi:sulfite exporter TauE/SafE family protein [Schleiferilactobacillus shenzhenensis]|uniref:Probable membrane transporter protein n=1 Tax=Schleiferilactobacillus shenzhenensis LY-73 TaxID=1231336 RepID=U4TM27_9LACO|nr:sulfite exporter TauE/SafE family protein [Schleiferilactobacillus shenzhenensis]ERL65921.1 hypothetical protein L248_1997 [Schleiferilactobacillus shenzhenensis LY-73]
MTDVVLLLIGLLIGIFVISLGGGGGAIYLGVLTAFFHLAPAAAAATSVVTALPALLLGAFGYYRQKTINFRVGNQMMVAAIPAVVVGSLLSPFIPKVIYTWLIAVILVLLGVQIMVRALRHQQAPAAGKGSTLKAAGFGVLAGLMVGVAGLSGGGPIIAGLLIMGLDMMHAVSTSAYVLVGTSIVGAILHAFGGQVDWSAGGFLMVGALAGALIAPVMMRKLTASKAGQYVQPVMGLLIIVMGIKTVL